MSMSPEIKKAIRGLVEKVSGSMTRVEGEKDFQKEAIKRIADKHDLDKALLRKLCSVFHKQRFNTEKQDFDDFETVYTEVFEMNQNGADIE